MRYVPVTLSAASLAAFLISPSLLAQTPTPAISIRQALHERHQAIVESPAPLAIGSELLATFANGKQCAMRVIKTNGTLGTVDTSLCANEKDLTVGQKLEVSLFDSSPAPVAVAHEEAPVPYKRALTDLLYQAPRGTVETELNYGFHQLGTTTNVANGGGGLSDAKFISETYVISANVGITENFMFGLEFGYSPISNNQVQYGKGSSSPGTSASFTSHGKTNPGFAGQYRILEQDSYPLNLDVFVGYSPNVGVATSATKFTSGNVYRGGELTSAGIAVGQKFSRISYDVQLHYKHYGTVLLSDADSNAVTRGDPVDTTSLIAAIQVEITSWVSVFANGYADFTTSQTINTQGSYQLILNSNNTLSGGGGFIFTILPERLAASAWFSQSSEANYDAASGVTGLQIQTGGYVYGATLKAQF